MKKVRAKTSLPKSFSYDWPLEFEIKADGRLIVRVPGLPGCRAQGRTPEEAVECLRRVIDRRVRAVPSTLFFVLDEFPDFPTVYALAEYRGHLYAATSRDSVLRSPNGLAGSFMPVPVARTPSRFFNPSADGKEGKGDYSGQVYCLERFAPPGKEAALFAGTNVNGTVYRTEDGLEWKEAFVTGEDRVHALCSFRGRLYAGTSSSGRVFAFDGEQWNAVGALHETAVTALGTFRGRVFAGTYPSGMIFVSESGLAWEESVRTGQHFVQCFREFKGRLYAGTSGPRGVVLYATENGRDWVPAYVSTREANLYALEVFDGAMYLGTGNGGRILRTADGRKFETAYAGDVEGVRAFAVFGDRLYAATEAGGGILQSLFDTSRLPEISGLAVEEAGSSHAVISWETDIPATSEVRYGEVLVSEMEAPFLNTVEDRTLTRKHTVRLTGLKAACEYRFQAASANRSATPAVSETSSFRTLPVPPPSLSSPTHPDPSRWERRADAEVHLEAAEPAMGFYYKVDRQPHTVPGPPEALFSDKGRVLLPNLPEGELWFHAVTVDESGNVGTEASHLRLRIDTEAPAPAEVACPTHPDPSRWVAENRLRASWVPPRDHSGVKGYWVAVDRDPSTVPGPGRGEFTEAPFFEAGPLSDGLWYLHVASQDVAGNVGREAAHFPVRVDTQALPPELRCPTHPDGSQWYPASQAVLEWTPPHELSGVEGYYWCLDGSPDTLPDPGTASFTRETRLSLCDLPEGVRYFHLRTKDGVGNLSAQAAHWTLRVDTKAPPPRVFSPTHPEPDRWYSRRRVVFEWEGPEEDSGVEGYFYRLDGRPETVPSPQDSHWTTGCTVAFDVPEDGLWYFHVVTRDRAGNVGSKAAHFPVRVDTRCGVPQVLSKTHPDPESWSSNPRAVFRFVPPDEPSGVAGYHYLLTEEPGAGLDPAIAPFTEEDTVALDLPRDGVHILLVAARDGAGNLSAEPARYTVRLDTSCPAPRLRSPSHPDPDRWYASPHVAVVWDPGEDRSGIAGYYLAWNREENWQPVLSAMKWIPAKGTDLTLPEDGTWYVHLSARDRAGNVSPCARLRVRVDSKAAPPAVRCLTHPPRHWTRNATPVFEWAPPAEPSGVEGYFVQVDASPHTVPDAKTEQWTAETRFLCGSLKDGKWWFHVTTKDKAGNLSAEAAHVPVWIDTMPPKSSVKPLPPVVDRTQIPVSWEGSDPLSGVASFDVEVREEGGPWLPWLTETKETSGSYAGADGRRYAFRCRARDGAGNEEPFPPGPQAETLTDISPPPPIVRLTASPKAGGDIELSWDPVEDPVSGTAFYRVYRWSEGEDRRRVADRVEGTSWTDPGSGLKEDKVYYYAVQPVDRMGNERHEGNASAGCLSDQSVGAPVVSSPTHPREEWSSNPNPVFTWLPPADSTGVAGYLTLLTRDPAERLSPETSTFTESPRAAYSNLEDGVWYFLVAARDRAGNVSPEPSRYMLKIDAERPSAPGVSVPTHPEEGRWYAERRILFCLHEAPKRSGLEAFYWIFGREARPPSSTEGLNRTTDPVIECAVREPAEWFLHVASRDRAGNLSPFATRAVRVAGPDLPPPRVDSPTHPREDEPEAEASPVFIWTENHDGSFVAEGWCWRLDRNPAGELGEEDVFTQVATARFENLEEGEWWFHVAAVKNGKPSALAAHRRIVIRRVGTLAGLLYSKDGRSPVVGAKVELRRGDKTAASALTDGKGGFRLANVPEGRYDLHLFFPGSPELRLREVAVKPGRNVRPLLFTEDAGVYPLPTEPGPVRFYYLLREDCRVTLEIFEASGALVDRLEDRKEGGAYAVTVWDAAGKPEGDYVVKITAKNLTKGAVSRYTAKKFRLKKIEAS